MRLLLTACEVDLVTGVVRRGETSDRLSRRECELLRFLARHPGETLDRDRLQQGVWGTARTGPSRAMDTTMRRLRAKLEADPAQPDHLLTIHGDGYRFEPTTVSERTVLATSHTPRLLALPNATADFDRLELRRADGVIRLTPREVAVLTILAEAEGRTVSRDEVHRAVWGAPHRGGERYVDVVVHHLRRKIEDDPQSPRVIRSIPGLGYTLVREQGTAPRPATIRTTNVGAPVDVLIGRETLLADLAASLQEARLVTLTGPPGVGKTRLALELAHHHRDRFDEVWFVSLAHVRDGVGAVAGVLGLADNGADPVAQIAAAIDARGAVLVVLDNAEAVVEEAAELVNRWLRETSRCRWLVTSQRLLRVPGELAVEVPPLNEDDAVRLLVARIDRGRPGWRWTPTEHDALRTVSRRLDHLPLALELAAARAVALQPSRVLSELDDRFRVLSGQRAPDPRHGSLWTALHASFTRLAPEEQAALGLLVAFPAGFDLDAAEQVLGDDGLDRVVGLREASWLAASADVDGEVRYELLESARAFVSTAADPDVLAEGLTRHADWALSLAGEPVARIVRAAPDLEAVVERFETTSPERSARAVLVLLPHLLVATAPRHADRLVERALTAVDALPASLQEQLWIASARVAGRCRDVAGAAARLANARAVGLGDRTGEIRVLQGYLAIMAGDYPEGARALDEVLSCFPDHSPIHLRALQGMAKVRLAEGDAEGSAALAHRYVAEMRRLGDSQAEARGLADLAMALREARQYGPAARALHRAEELFTAANDRASLAHLATYDGHLRYEQDDLRGAAERIEASRQACAALGDLRGVAAADGNLASILVEQGDLGGAEVLLDRALAQHRVFELRGFVVLCSITRGQLMQRRGRSDLAVEAYREACSEAAEGGMRRLWATARVFGAVALAEARLADEAASWLVEARTAAPDLAVPVATAIVAHHRGEGAALAEVLADAREVAATSSALRWLVSRGRAALG